MSKRERQAEVKKVEAESLRWQARSAVAESGIVSYGGRLTAVGSMEGIQSLLDQRGPQSARVLREALLENFEGILECRERANLDTFQKHCDALKAGGDAEIYAAQSRFRNVSGLDPSLWRVDQNGVVVLTLKDPDRVSQKTQPVLQSSSLDQQVVRGRFRVFSGLSSRLKALPGLSLFLA